MLKGNKKDDLPIIKELHFEDGPNCFKYSDNCYSVNVPKEQIMNERLSEYGYFIRIIWLDKGIPTNKYRTYKLTEHEHKTLIESINQFIDQDYSVIFHLNIIEEICKNSEMESTYYATSKLTGKRKDIKRNLLKFFSKDYLKIGNRVIFKRHVVMAETFKVINENYSEKIDIDFFLD